MAWYICKFKFHSELKLFELKFSAQKMSWNSELKYFWVEIFSFEKELKFRAEILASQKLWVENFRYFQSESVEVKQPFVDF